MPPWTDQLLDHARFLVFAWNAIGFGASALLIARARAHGEKVWGDGLTVALLYNLTLVYVANNVARPPLSAGGAIAWAVRDAVDLGIPLLVVHTFFAEERAKLRRPRWWGGAVAGMYAGVIAALAITVVAPFLAGPWWGLRAHSYPAFVALLAISSALTSMLVWETWHSGAVVVKRQLSGWLVLGFGLVALTHLIQLITGLASLNITIAVPPAFLLFALSYYVHPRTFDTLIKEVTFWFFVFLAVYGAWWVVTRAPWLSDPRSFPLLILAIWPAIALTPWLQSAWVRWLDRRLLGRWLTPGQARTFFVSGLEGAITEADLLGSAAHALTRIFGSGARILLDPAPRPDSGAGMRAEVRIGGELRGWIEVEPRLHRLQFMSADIALLEELAAEFSVLLDNLRLRETKLEQERREENLERLAAQAELKALRAQINPHFLFNSLSAIAGLISKDATRARETVEQLAEVFRYSLYRSEKEWVPLQEELDFVTAYLDVERARFGARLQVRISVEEAARQVPVPAMVLQVLVENAIQHGVSSVRGAGLVSICGHCADQRLRLEVRDNGPGLKLDRGASTGFGLRNVEDRLRIYFGSGASLHIGREDPLTVAAIEMPVRKAAPDPEVLPA